ncbi:MULTISPECIES: GAF domain-containing protein [Rhodococcus]|uniref:GAF domain-containing protein n=1 Tax=Rhodococcus qingshengii JCM 15477 TaxID=1303681 RepID=A0AB38RNJ2_RHOSG|nr:MULTISPECIES: GAF domain-containing protein [Rhodococcus]MDA3635332.1 GAF domain-containing protein [Rhodococcus sp. C-2]UPU46767.1 GAF domain-containing protein [Rhodococcus qingshengii JCM 15477]
MDCDDISAPLDTLSPFVGTRAAQQYDPDEIATAVEHFGALLRTPMKLSALLQSVCSQVVATIPTADTAGVTMSNRPETVACTDERALDVDVDQYRASEGPCLESARTRPVVRVRFDDAAQRWPEFASNVAGTSNVAGIGVASYFSAPLMTDGHLVGALNLYSSARSTRFF